MKKTDAMELAKGCLGDLVESLNNGSTESLTRYLDALAKFRNYSLNNILMIMKQYPSAESVAGYKTWKELGRWVKPGERGIAIIAPMARRSLIEQNKKEVANTNPSNDAKDKTDDHPFGFRVVHVFDVKQTEGADLPKLSEVNDDPGMAYELLIDVFGSLGIRIMREHLPNGTLGASRGGMVVLSQGMNLGQEFQVMAHELAHELLHQGAERHHSRLPIQVVETEAEAVAYVVCKAHGIDATAATNDYIRLYRGDAKLIEESFNRIRGAAGKILFLMSEAEEARKVTEESLVAGYDDTISAVWKHSS